MSLLLLGRAIPALVKFHRVYQGKKGLQRRCDIHAQHQKKKAERTARLNEDIEEWQARSEETGRQKEEPRRLQEALKARKEQLRRLGEARKSKRMIVMTRTNTDDGMISARSCSIVPKPRLGFQTLQWSCSPGCQNCSVLKACSLTLKQLYQVSGKDVKRLFKPEPERLSWHPDRSVPVNSCKQRPRRCSRWFKHYWTTALKNGDNSK